ncbi:MAG TPA: PEGA domain-containing protein [Polyangiaceae bacterium]|nr:PEGA domain-containing protein [Polyangiaceae bacterium]
MTKSCVTALLCGALLLPCRVGHAEDVKAGAGASALDADALIRAGLDARKKGDDAAALGLFERAVAAHRTPRGVAQVGLAEQALGRWEDAEQHLLEATASSSDPWISAHRGALQTSLETVRAHLGTLELAVDVPDAELVIDGGPRGNVGAPLRLAAGTYAIEVRHEGYYSVTRQVVIVASQTSRETVALRRVEAPPQAPPPPPAPVAVAPPRDEAPASGSRFGSTKWWLLGGGGVVAAGGAIALIARQGEVSAYNDDASCPGASDPNQPARCAGRLSTGRTLETLGIVGLVGGALLGAASGVLLVIDAPQPGSARAARNWGVACTGRF